MTRTQLVCGEIFLFYPAAADTMHVSYRKKKDEAMRYGFYYLLFFIGMPLVLWLLLRKRPIWAKRWFQAGVISLIIVLGAALALIPRKSTQAYPSPEEAFRYKNSGEILLVLEGEQSAYVIAKQSGSTYAYDLVARDGGVWRPVTGVSANPTVIASGSAVIRIYQYGKTGDYYLSVTDGGGQDVTVTDNRGSQFHRLGDTYAVSGGTFSAYTYYAYVPDLDEAYQLTVSGQAVILS